MIEFPGTAQRSEELQKRFASFFGPAVRIFEAWLAQPLDDILRESDLPDATKSIAWMLNTQALRQYRSIVELCRIGEACNASIIARSLFETALAANYVLAPTFEIVVEPQRDKATDAPLPDKWQVRNPKDGEVSTSLTREERTHLYAAHCVVQAAKIAAAGDGISPVDPKYAEQAKQQIGPKWTYIQKNQRTYSGLSVENLAKAIGKPYPLWYEQVYRDQSRRVHGVDIFTHVFGGSTGSPSPAWLSTVEDVGFVLYCANTLFLLVANTLNIQVPMGQETEKLLRGFFVEFQKICSEHGST